MNITLDLLQLTWRHFKVLSTCHPQLDDQQRNLIPELTTPFLCAWQGCDEARAESEIVEATRYFRHVNNHAEEYRGEKGKAISCLWFNASSGQLCSFKVSTVSKLKDHLRSHSQEKLVGCPRLEREKRSILNPDPESYSVAGAEACSPTDPSSTTTASGRRRSRRWRTAARTVRRCSRSSATSATTCARTSTTTSAPSAR